MQEKITRPTVLCLGGLDPSGGAGLQADIETIAANGGHALPIATCLTVQNSQNVDSVKPVESDLILQQFESLFADLPIAACKIGLVPNTQIVDTLAEIIARLGDIPIVFDPVLQASGGAPLTESELIPALINKLLPHIRVLTPNLSELRALSDHDRDDAERARALCHAGASYVLVTTYRTDSDDCLITHSLFSAHPSQGEDPVNFSCEKLEHEYHGSGCTLSSALTTQLALGRPIKTAIELAISYTVSSLSKAERLGQGQYIPRRVF